MLLLQVQPVTELLVFLELVERTRDTRECNLHRERFAPGEPAIKIEEELLRCYL